MSSSSGSDGEPHLSSVREKRHRFKTYSQRLADVHSRVRPDLSARREAPLEGHATFFSESLARSRELCASSAWAAFSSATGSAGASLPLLLSRVGQVVEAFALALPSCCAESAASNGANLGGALASAGTGTLPALLDALQALARDVGPELIPHLPRALGPLTEATLDVGLWRDPEAMRELAAALAGLVRTLGAHLAPSAARFLALTARLRSCPHEHVREATALAVGPVLRLGSPRDARRGTRSALARAAATPTPRQVDAASALLAAACAAADGCLHSRAGDVLRELLDPSALAPLAAAAPRRGARPARGAPSAAADGAAGSRAEGAPATPPPASAASLAARQAAVTAHAMDRLLGRGGRGKLGAFWAAILARCTLELEKVEAAATEGRRGSAAAEAAAPSPPLLPLSLSVSLLARAVAWQGGSAVEDYAPIGRLLARATEVAVRLGAAEAGDPGLTPADSELFAGSSLAASPAPAALALALAFVRGHRNAVGASAGPSGLAALAPCWDRLLGGLPSASAIEFARGCADEGPAGLALLRGSLPPFLALLERGLAAGPAVSEACWALLADVEGGLRGDAEFATAPVPAGICRAVAAALEGEGGADAASPPPVASLPVAWAALRALRLASADATERARLALAFGRRAVAGGADRRARALGAFALARAAEELGGDGAGGRAPSAGAALPSAGELAGELLAASEAEPLNPHLAAAAAAVLRACPNAVESVGAFEAAVAAYEPALRDPSPARRRAALEVLAALPEPTLLAPAAPADGDADAAAPPTRPRLVAALLASASESPAAGSSRDATLTLGRVAAWFEFSRLPAPLRSLAIHGCVGALYARFSAFWAPSSAALGAALNAAPEESAPVLLRALELAQRDMLAGVKAGQIGLAGLFDEGEEAWPEGAAAAAAGGAGGPDGDAEATPAPLAGPFRAFLLSPYAPGASPLESAGSPVRVPGGRPAAPAAAGATSGDVRLTHCLRALGAAGPGRVETLARGWVPAFLSYVDAKKGISGEAEEEEAEAEGKEEVALGAGVEAEVCASPDGDDAGDSAALRSRAPLTAAGPGTGGRGVGRRAWRTCLGEWLKLIESLRGVRGTYRFAEVLRALLGLVSDTDDAVAVVAVRCLRPFRLRGVAPYLGRLARLADDKTIRAEMVSFPLALDAGESSARADETEGSTLEAAHRAAFAPLLVAVLWPKMRAQSRKRVAGRANVPPSRAAVLNFLAAAEPEELRALLARVLAPVAASLPSREAVLGGPGVAGSSGPGGNAGGDGDGEGAGAAAMPAALAAAAPDANADAIAAAALLPPWSGVLGLGRGAALLSGLDRAALVSTKPPKLLGVLRTLADLLRHLRHRISAFLPDVLAIVLVLLEEAVVGVGLAAEGEAENEGRGEGAFGPVDAREVRALTMRLLVTLAETFPDLESLDFGWPRALAAAAALAPRAPLEAASPQPPLALQLAAALAASPRLRHVLVGGAPGAAGAVAPAALAPSPAYRAATPLADAALATLLVPSASDASRDAAMRVAEGLAHAGGAVTEALLRDSLEPLLGAMRGAVLALAPGGDRTAAAAAATATAALAPAARKHAKATRSRAATEVSARALAVLEVAGPRARAAGAGPPLSAALLPLVARARAGDPRAEAAAARVLQALAALWGAREGEGVEARPDGRAPGAPDASSPTGAAEAAALAEAWATLSPLARRFTEGEAGVALTAATSAVAEASMRASLGRAPAIGEAAGRGRPARLTAAEQRAAAARVLADLNARSMDEPDYDRRVGAYLGLREASWLDLGAEGAPTVTQRCLADLTQGEDLGLRQSAAVALKSLLDAACAEGRAPAPGPAADPAGRPALGRAAWGVALPALRAALGSASVAVRGEAASLLGAVAASAPHRLPEAALLTHHDSEADFFQNVAHLQMHRRARALTRAARAVRSAEAVPAPASLCTLLTPLLLRMLRESSGSDEQAHESDVPDLGRVAGVTQAAVELLSALASRLAWQPYRQLLASLLRALRASGTSNSDKDGTSAAQRPIIRAICGVLDANRFDAVGDVAAAAADVGEAEGEVNGEAADAEADAAGSGTGRAEGGEDGDGEEVIDVDIEGGGDGGEDLDLEGEGAEAGGETGIAGEAQGSPGRPGGASPAPPDPREIRGFLLSRVIPELKRHLIVKDEVRAPVALAIAGVLRTLPESASRQALPGLLQTVANLLADKRQHVRDGARRVMVELARTLGPAKLPFVFETLRVACPARGFTSHVLGYTVLAVIDGLRPAKQSAASPGGDLDGSEGREMTEGEEAAPSPAPAPAPLTFEETDTRGMDACLTAIVETVEAEVFGEVGEAKDERAFAAARRETRARPAAALLAAAAELCGWREGVQTLLELPRRYLASASDPRMRHGVRSLYEAIARGSTINRTAEPRDIAMFVFATLGNALDAERRANDLLSRGAESASAGGGALPSAFGGSGDGDARAGGDAGGVPGADEPKRIPRGGDSWRRLHQVEDERKEAERRTAEAAGARYAHLESLMAVELLRGALRRGRIRPGDEDSEALLAPILPLLVRALSSRHSATSAAALAVLGQLVKARHPGMGAVAQPAGKACVRTLRDMASPSGEQAGAVFKLLSGLIHAAKDAEAADEAVAARDEAAYDTGPSASESSGASEAEADERDAEEADREERARLRADAGLARAEVARQLKLLDRRAASRAASREARLERRRARRRRRERAADGAGRGPAGPEAGAAGGPAYFQPTTDQLRYILDWAYVDAEESVTSFSRLSLLKAIIRRRLVVPEVYDVMGRVQEVMIRSQGQGARASAASCLLAFLLDYPLGKKRLEQHVTFLLENLSYEHETGRQAALKMLGLVVSKFPAPLVERWSDLIFVPLVQRVVADPATSCRTLAAEALVALLGRLGPARRDSASRLAILWLEGGDPRLARAGAQALRALASAEGSAAFARRVPRLLPALAGVLERELARDLAEARGDAARDSASAAGGGSDDDGGDAPDATPRRGVRHERHGDDTGDQPDTGGDASAPAAWQAAYHALLLLETAREAAPASLTTPLAALGDEEGWVPEEPPLAESPAEGGGRSGPDGPGPDAESDEEDAAPAAAPHGTIFRPPRDGTSRPRGCLYSFPGESAAEAFNAASRVLLASADLLLHGHSWVRAASARAVGTALADADASRALLRVRYPGALARALLRQLADASDDERALRTQALRCLVFLAEPMLERDAALGLVPECTLPETADADAGADADADADAGADEADADADADAGADEADADADADADTNADTGADEAEVEGDAATEGGASGPLSAAHPTSGDEELFRRRRRARREELSLADMSRLVARAAEDRSYSKREGRSASLRLIAALSSRLGPERCRPYLTLLVRPMVRSTTKGGPAESPEAAELVAEVAQHLRGLLGSRLMLAAYNASRDEVEEARVARRARAARAAIVAPELAARRRVQRQARKKAGKRKQVEEIRRQRSAGHIVKNRKKSKGEAEEAAGYKRRKQQH